MIKKNHIYILLLNIVAIGFYFYHFFNIDIGVSHDIMFSTPDSKGYLSVAHWIQLGTGGHNTLHRPFLYPLFIFLTYSTFNIYFLWFAQFLLWLLSINLTYLSIKILTQKLLLSYLGAFIMMSNLSFLFLTFHALTEVATIFLLSYLVYFLAKNYKSFKNVYFIHGIIGFLSLLTVLKPVFLIPLVAAIICAPLLYYKSYKRRPKNILWLTAMLIPLFIQLTIMKVKNDLLTVSTIGKDTFTNYYFSFGMRDIETISLEEARILSKELTTQEKLEYIGNHSKVYYDFFLKNLVDNINGKPVFLYSPKGYEHPALQKYMLDFNKKFFYIHKFAIFPIVILLLITLFKKEYNKHVILLILTGLTAYYILITGISFWQGDRLVLPSIGLWACLYTYVLYLYFELTLHIYRKIRG